MAKKKSRGSSKLKHPLRIRKSLAFGADASVQSALTFDTPMHQIGGGIMLIGAYIGPRNPEEVPDPAGNTPMPFAAQLVLGEVTDFVFEDDQQCITSLSRHQGYVGAAGATTWDWPVAFPVIVGIPIITKEMSLVMSAFNDAEFNSITYTLTMVYVPHKVDDKTLMQHLMAFTEIS